MATSTRVLQRSGGDQAIAGPRLFSAIEAVYVGPHWKSTTTESWHSRYGNALYQNWIEF